jgi:hypothetical protein
MNSKQCNKPDPQIYIIQLGIVGLCCGNPSPVAPPPLNGPNGYGALGINIYVLRTVVLVLWDSTFI